jgi:hypothetical protein
MLTEERGSASRSAEPLDLELRIVAAFTKVHLPRSGGHGVSSSEVPSSGLKPLINTLLISKKVGDESQTLSQLLEHFRDFHVHFHGF